MTTYATPDAIAARLRLAEQDAESEVLGGTLRLRELTRAQFREASAWAITTAEIERERERGRRLALAKLDDPVQRQQALGRYWIGVAETATDLDRWHAALVAVGVVEPQFDREAILQWPHRSDLWDELYRIAQAILDLSEVGTASLKSGNPQPAAE